jgi:hypothetical protein
MAAAISSDMECYEQASEKKKNIANHSASAIGPNQLLLTHV